MALPSFTLLRPTSVEETADLLERYKGDAKLIAGGTDLIPSLKQRLFTPKYLVDISRIHQLRELSFDPSEGLVIGAAVKLRQISDSELIRRQFAVLAEAANVVASPVLRNMGTVGGNVCLDTRCVWYNQSYLWRKSCGFCLKKDGTICHVAPGGSMCWAVFSGDVAAALLSLGANVEIVSAAGRRWIALTEFYSNEGRSPLCLGTNEIVTRIQVPAASAGLLGRYEKLRIRGSIDYPLAGVAMTLRRSDGSWFLERVAITAVNPGPRVIDIPEEIRFSAEVHAFALIERVVAAVGRTAKPLRTSALTPEYRREIVKIQTRRAILESIKDGRTSG